MSESERTTFTCNGCGATDYLTDEFGIPRSWSTISGEATYAETEAEKLERVGKLGNAASGRRSVGRKGVHLCPKCSQVIRQWLLDARDRIKAASDA